MPAAAMRGSAGPTAAKNTTAWPRAASPSALSIATLAWPPLMWAWSATTTIFIVGAYLRTMTKAKLVKVRQSRARASLVKAASACLRPGIFQK